LVHCSVVNANQRGEEKIFILKFQKNGVNLEKRMGITKFVTVLWNATSVSPEENPVKRHGKHTSFRQ
jgi:hypothetical protein